MALVHDTLVVVPLAMLSGLSNLQLPSLKAVIGFFYWWLNHGLLIFPLIFNYESNKIYTSWFCFGIVLTKSKQFRGTASMKCSSFNRSICME
jgi:hypothetical protein